MKAVPSRLKPFNASERDLVLRCRRGDRAAWDEFVRLQIPVVERLLARIVGGGPALEDLVQTTFLEAIKSFARFRGEASLSTWVSRIAVHVAHRYFRTKKRRPPALEVIGPGMEPASEDLSPSTAADRRRVARRLIGLLENLTAKKRIAFVLHAIEGYSVDEVAALMDTRRATIRSRLWFARREIDALLASDPVLREIDLSDLVEG